MCPHALVSPVFYILIKQTALCVVAYLGIVLGNTLNTHATCSEYSHAIEILTDHLQKYVFPSPAQSRRASPWA